MRKLESTIQSRTERKNNEKKVKGRAGKKAIILTVAIALVLVSVIGGTFAYLTSVTQPAVNTFTYGDINITLAETPTDLDGDGDDNTNTYKMFPGRDIEKDPVITVLAGSENSWLFVKLEKSDNFDTFMTFEMADGWQALENNEGVYYMEVDLKEEDQEFAVLKDNKVSVIEEVTKQQLNDLDIAGANYPTLKVTGYAIQRDAEIAGIDTAIEAWELVAGEELTVI